MAPRTPGTQIRSRSLAVLCVGIAIFLIARDLLLPHVGEVEVWFGIEVHGRWARISAVIHWAIYIAAGIGFWRESRWVWRSAVPYAVYVAASHLVWNLTSPSGGGLMPGAAQFLLFLIPAMVLSRLRPSTID